MIPSMWPQDILAKLNQPVDSDSKSDYRFDEFGFKVEEDDEGKKSSEKFDNAVEDPQQR